LNQFDVELPSYYIYEQKTLVTKDGNAKLDYIIINNNTIESLKKTNDFKNDFPYEKDVGIIKFINESIPGFNVSLKQR